MTELLAFALDLVEDAIVAEVFRSSELCKVEMGEGSIGNWK